MPRTVAFTLALVALAGGIFAKIDVGTCLLRASIAFGIGWLLASLWEAMVTNKHSEEKIVHNAEVSAESPDQEDRERAEELPKAA